MKKFVVASVLAFMAAGFVACSGDDDNGYVSETRKPQDYITIWDELKGAEAKGAKFIIPKSYKSEKPPFIMLMGGGDEHYIVVENIVKNKRFDEIQSFKINDGKCEIEKIRRSGSTDPSVVKIKCDVKSVSKIEIDTIAGKVTYKF